MERAASLGIIAAIAAGVLWGFLGPFVRYFSDNGISAIQMTAMRYIILVVIVFVIIALRKRDEFHIEPKMLLIMILMGVVGVALNSSCYLESMTMIPLSMATILQYLSPFIVVALSVPLFKEELTKKKAVAVVVAFLGCVLCTGVMTDPGSVNLWGVLLGALSGLFYSVYTLGSKDASSKGYGSWTILFYSSIFCLLVLLPFSDIGSAFTKCFSTSEMAVAIIVFAILLTLAPFALYNWSISKIGAGDAAIITFVEPMTAAIVGLAMYREMLTIDTAFGILMIMFSLMLVNRDWNSST